MQRQQDIAGQRRGSAIDLLVTGSSGFLGSQFVVAWLQRHPQARIACLVRAEDDIGADRKLRAALLQAGNDRAVGAAIDPLLPRVTAIRGDLDGAGWIDAAARWRAEGGDRPFRLLHCAANLSFRAGDREAVRDVNIGGTRSMLAAAERLGACEFNYVSTAYVAGDRSGDILEDASDTAPGFSNAYEESKWEAELLVRSSSARTGLPFRILRPSIIIADSVTHRMSALSGFYKVIETMMLLGRMPRVQGHTILLPVPPGSMLDLIPVDVVVTEMIALLEAGTASLGHAFHLTSDAPLSLMEVMRTLSPLAGLSIGQQETDGPPCDRLAEFFTQRLRHYMPYMGQVRRFDRTNVRKAGVRQQSLIDVDRLRQYVTSFLARTPGQSTPGSVAQRPLPASVLVA